MAVNQPTAYIPCILLWNLLTSFLVRMCVRVRAVCSIDIFENGTFEHFTPAVPDNFETSLMRCLCVRVSIQYFVRGLRKTFMVCYKLTINCAYGENRTTLTGCIVT